MCVRLYVCLCAFPLLVNGTIAQHHDSMSTDDFGYNPDGQDAVTIADALGGILQLLPLKHANVVLFWALFDFLRRFVFLLSLIHI